MAVFEAQNDNNVLRLCGRKQTRLQHDIQTNNLLMLPTKQFGCTTSLLLGHLVSGDTPDLTARSDLDRNSTFLRQCLRHL